MSRFRIRVWADGKGHWFEIRNRNTIIRTTWALGSAKAAREDAQRIVDNLEAAPAAKAAA